MDEIDPIYSGVSSASPMPRTGFMSDYKKDLEDYFCRFTFGQFITLVLFEIVTLFFVFYLGAKYGTDLVGGNSMGRRGVQEEEGLLPQGKKSVEEIVGDKGGAYTYPEVLSGNSKAIRIKPSGVTSADLEKQAYRRDLGRDEGQETAPIQVPSARDRDDDIAAKSEPAHPVIKEIVSTPQEKVFPKPEAKAQNGSQNIPQNISQNISKTGSKTIVKTPAQLTAEEIEKEARQNPPAPLPDAESSPSAPQDGEPIAEAKPAGIEKPILPPIPSGKYSIQMGSYPSIGEAQAALKVWKKKGYSAYMKEADIPGKGLWYRVRLGSFSSKDQAQTFLDKIKKKEKKTGIVVSNKG